MRRITVRVSSEYDVLIGSGILKQCGSHITERVKPCKAAIISDDTVEALYGNEAAQSLMESGFEVSRFVFPHGEASKNLMVLGELLEFLASGEFSRSDVIVALGGGVTGDMAGFAAAVYLRGIRFIQIPTTFLAAIDSSVGGKTAVDLKAGKNLAGAFYQPEMVICDVDVLATLPSDTFRDGTAEALKYGVIGDEKLFDLISGWSLNAGLAESSHKKEQTILLEEVIQRCIEMKRDIVMEDEFDTGLRQILNLGHTLGHSLESLSDYQLTHGRAVAIGMYLISKAAWKQGIAETDFSQRIKTALIHNGLPISCKFTPEEIAKGTLTDKKRRGKTISFVFPQKIGSCVIEKVAVDQVVELVRSCVATDIRIGPDPLSGTVEIISSKSDAHRVFIAAALAETPTEVALHGCSKDVEATISCLRSLGAEIVQRPEGVWNVTPIRRTGRTWDAPMMICDDGMDFGENRTLNRQDSRAILNCGESGSTLRFLIPVVAALGKRAILTGEGRLPERPVKMLLDELRKHGCVFSADHLPFEVGSSFSGGRFELPGNVSSQFVTGLLLALPLLKADSEIIITSTMESKAYVNMTVSTLRTFNILVEETETGYRVKGNQTYRSSAGRIFVDGDWSNAAFWLAAGAAGKTVSCKGLKMDSQQGDKAMVELLKRFGSDLFVEGDTVTAKPPDRSGESETKINKGLLNACRIDASQIPDLVPVLAVIAAAASGTTEIYNAGRLRIKESDRLSAMCECLDRLGIDVEELEDGLRIHGIGGTAKQAKTSAIVPGFNDHRIVMAMAIAAVALRMEITIQGTEAVEKSYPTFFREFRNLGGIADVL